MYANIVELCSVNDKDSYFYVENARNEGRDVFTMNGKYVTVIKDTPYWRSPDAEFAYTPDGVYEFVNGQVVYRG